MFKGAAAGSRRKNAKDTFSDETSNANLANIPRRPYQPTPPTGLTPPGRYSGMPGEEGSDYFRKPPGANGDQLPQAPQWSINPARVWESVRLRFNPIRGLTFERLVNYIEQWWYGYFRYAGFTWTTMMRRDYQLKIDAPKRFKSAARHGYEILLTEEGQDQVDEAEKQNTSQMGRDPSQMPDQTKTMAQQQQEFLKEFYDNVTATDALNPNKEGGFALLVRQMMESVALYYAVHEIVWQPKEDGSLSAKFIYCPIWWFEGVRGKLRYLDSEFQVWGREMADGEWLVTCGDGLMECAGIIYMLKHGSLKAWVAYLEKFGMPGLLGKTHAKKDTAEWVAMKEALIEFSNEFAAVIGGCSGDLKENDISLIEARNAENGKAFDSLIEKLDRAITQLFRGGDLSTSSGANRMGASLQGDESEVLETDDLSMVEETLMAQVSRFALAWKFGNDVKPLAYVKLRTAPQKDFASDIAVDQFITSVGGELDAQETYERYHRSLPNEGAKTLKAPVAAGPGGAGGQQDMEETGALRQMDRTDFTNSQFANMKKRGFDEVALRKFASAYSKDVEPLVNRLKAIYKIDHPELFRNRLASFLNELEQMKKGLGHDNEVSQVLNQVLSAALANGVADARLNPKRLKHNTAKV